MLHLDHPFFVGIQFHPEFTSRPLQPSPPYLGLLLAASGKLENYVQRGCRLSPRYNVLLSLFAYVKEFLLKWGLGVHQSIKQCTLYIQGSEIILTIVDIMISVKVKRYL